MSNKEKNRFFDPRKPEQPVEIYGIDTKALLRLGRAATDLGALPWKAHAGIRVLPHAVRLVPLIEEMQTGDGLTPEDIRPYRKPIKRLSGKLNAADKFAATTGAIAVGIPARRALNRKIERDFPDRAAEAINEARKAVAKIEREVDHIASFENPREQFLTEIQDLAQTVTVAIHEEREHRVRQNIPAVVERETPRGLLGIFTKAVRKVRNFFGFLGRRRRPVVNPEITAYDAGAGLEQTIRKLTRNRRASEKQLPMLSKLLFDRAPKTSSLNKDRLAFAAPEILNFLFSTAPDDDEATALIDSVIRNPHELRFVTKFKKRYRHYSLESIQRASVTLFPALRDVLPTDGAKVQESFAQIQELLQSHQLETADDEPEEALKVTLRSRFKKLIPRFKTPKHPPRLRGA